MQIKDELARIPGVSDIILFGERDYSMRIWVDPMKMAQRNLTAGDVVQAVREQNMQVATGRVGSRRRMKDSKVLTPRLSTLGRLTDVDQFADIILKADADGRTVRICDIGTVELGAKNSDVDVRFDGKPTVFLAIFQRPDANALESHDLILDKMKELSSIIPEGISWDVAFDTSALHARIDQRSVQDAARCGHSGSRRGARVFAELAFVAHSNDRRAGGNHRHFHSDGRVWIQLE